MCESEKSKPNRKKKKLCQTRLQHSQSAIEMSKRLRNNRAQQKTRKEEEKQSQPKQLFLTGERKLFFRVSRLSGAGAQHNSSSPNIVYFFLIVPKQQRPPTKHYLFPRRIGFIIIF
jgi:hypothetical protein